jgi:hypothetical protein
MTEQMKLRGTLEGHNGWVTQIATTNEVPDMILSSSRGTLNIDSLLSFFPFVFAVACNKWTLARLGTPCSMPRWLTVPVAWVVVPICTRFEGSAC